MRRTTWCALLWTPCLFAGFAPCRSGAGTEQEAKVKGEPAPVKAREATPPAAGPTGTAKIRREAEALRHLIGSELALAFLRAASDLPAVAPRTVYRDADRRSFLTEAGRLDEGRRKALTPIAVD